LLELALTFYTKALDATDGDEELASAHKNIAATLQHLATLRPAGSGAGSSSSATCSVQMDTLREVVSHR
jgi:hypothetical protein